MYVIKDLKANNYFAFIIYVVDIFLIINNEDKRKGFIDKFSNKFKLTNLGQIHWLFGIKVIQNETEQQKSI